MSFIGSSVRSTPLNGRPEHELVDEEMIADEQVRLHRARRDFEGLDDERPDEQREHDRDDQRLEVLAGD